MNRTCNINKLCSNQDFVTGMTNLDEQYTLGFSDYSAIS